MQSYQKEEAVRVVTRARFKAGVSTQDEVQAMGEAKKAFLSALADSFKDAGTTCEPSQDSIRVSNGKLKIEIHLDDDRVALSPRTFSAPASVYYDPGSKRYRTEATGTDEEPCPLVVVARTVAGYLYPPKSDG
jgi:hypothetical protein